LRKAIVAAIDSGSLKQLLAEGTPSRDFEALVRADIDYDKQVSELIDRANDEGWIGELVDAALEARAANPRFVAVVQPIAGKIKAGEELAPDEAPEGRIPTRALTSSPGFLSPLLLIGPVAIIGAIAFLWWNEGFAVLVNDEASQVVEAQASGPLPANENKLVHVVGPATAQSPIQDSEVGITFVGQVSVTRTKTEMYQWKQNATVVSHKDDDGNTTTTTTYNYTREWSDRRSTPPCSSIRTAMKIPRCCSAMRASPPAMRSWAAGRSIPIYSAALIIRRS
jgi:hypothetical protein